MITEREAIEVVRRELVRIGHAPLDPERSTVARAVVAGRDSWVVRAASVMSDEPEWMQVQWEAVPHFVDAASGRWFGYQVGSVRHFTDPDDRARDERERPGPGQISSSPKL